MKISYNENTHVHYQTEITNENIKLGLYFIRKGFKDKIQFGSILHEVKISDPTIIIDKHNKIIKT